MSGSVFITIKTARTDLGPMIGNAVAGRRLECLNDLQGHLQACAGRLSDDEVDVAYNSSVAGVKASGTVTITNASVAGADTMTVAGVALTVVTSGTPTATQFLKGASDTATATNLAAKINANTTINQVVKATSAAGVVTVTSLVDGPVGNFVPLATSNATGFGLSAATLASGAGGPNPAVSFT